MGSPLAAKHVPQRTCIACRQTRGKRELVRIVYTDRLEVDLTGKKPGRGAYLCHRRTCWEGALAKGKLEHALRAKINSADRQTIENYARTLTG